MLILPVEQTQPLGSSYDQADYLQALGRWFVRGKSFAAVQEATAKKYCQKILDAPEAQPFFILVKSLGEFTLWHETQEPPAMTPPAVATLETPETPAVPSARMFRGQVVQSPATPPVNSDESVVKTYRGQVVQSPAVASETPVKAAKVYRGKSY